MITAHRAGACTLPENFDAEVLSRLSQAEDVTDAVRDLMPLHFPAKFPEVFVRQRSGFDCLLGNPPWEKVMVEQKVWWGRHTPGIRSLPEKDMNDAIDRLRLARPDLEADFQADIARNDRTRAVLLAGPFPGIGRSHPDLYKAFAWRNWHLSRIDTGRAGIVVPRTALADAGMAKWRRDVLRRASCHLAILRNKSHWVFEDVHAADSQIRLSGLHSNWKSRPAAPQVWNRRSAVRMSSCRGRTNAKTLPQIPEHPGVQRRLNSESYGHMCA